MLFRKPPHQFTWALCSVTASNAAFRKQSLHLLGQNFLLPGWPLYYTVFYYSSIPKVKVLAQYTVWPLEAPVCRL